MAKFQFANRATSTLVRALSPSETILRINVLDAPKYPQPDLASPMQLTLTSAAGVVEYVTCTSRVGEDFTVVRGQEGTPANTFPIGSRVELALTAVVLKNFLQVGGGAMTGPIDMAGNEISNVAIRGATIPAGMNCPMIAAMDNNQTYALRFPNGGARPQIGNYDVLSFDHMSFFVFAAWIQPENIPPWLKLCDGTLNTPDLRNRFILGVVPGQFPAGTTGGNFTSFTDNSPAHNHVGLTDMVYLQNGNMPQLNQPNVSIRSNIDGAGGNAQAINNIWFNPGQEYSTAAPHQHGIFPDGVHYHSAFTAPPYVAMCYVMFRL
jgi:hypothetical protein